MTPRILTRHSSLLALCSAALASLVLFGGSARAQGDPGGRYWMAIGGSSPGTPAEFRLDETQSSLTDTYLDLTIHGFWVTPRIGGDGMLYQQIQIPGLGVLQEAGYPELPVARAEVGVLTTAPTVILADVSVMARMSFPAMLVWPHPIPEVDDAYDAWAAEQFVRDAAAYSAATPWPAAAAEPSVPVRSILWPIHAGQVVLHPMQWTATTGTLDVTVSARFHFAHGGVTRAMVPATRPTAGAATALLINDPIVSPTLPVEPVRYSGEYLFVYPSRYTMALDPLMTQKRMRGYHVTQAHTEDVGTTCIAIRSYIETWFAAHPVGDHFCLLVGDWYEIQLCEGPPPYYGYFSDDLYGDADADGVDDLWKEVYVGRLSPINDFYCSVIANRILDYEDAPSVSEDFGTAALIAHSEDAPGKYQAAQEAVRLATYTSVAPNFQTIYGSASGVGNADIDSAAKRDGLVCYRGHGGELGWGGWNTTGSDYTIGDIAALFTYPVYPVVWSITCSTNNIMYPLDDCLGEYWMNTDAAAFYGSYMVSNTADNHELDFRLFQAVFNLGAAFTTHARAIEYAEHMTTFAYGPNNPWMYFLLGDPEMQIRRQPVGSGPPNIVIHGMPPSIEAGCALSGCHTPVDIQIGNAAGAPEPGVLVSIWKRGTDATADEVLDNAYTSVDGFAHFVVPAMTPGMLYVTARNENADVVRDSTPVVSLTDVGTGAVAGGVFRAEPSPTPGPTRLVFSAPLTEERRIQVVDVQGRAVATLTAPRGATDVRWAGTDAGGRAVPAGLYLARIATSEVFQTARILIAR